MEIFEVQQGSTVMTTQQPTCRAWAPTGQHTSNLEAIESP